MFLGRFEEGSWRLRSCGKLTRSHKIRGRRKMMNLRIGEHSNFTSNGKLILGAGRLIVNRRATRISPCLLFHGVCYVYNRLMEYQVFWDSLISGHPLSTISHVPYGIFCKLELKKPRIANLFCHILAQPDLCL